jgi:nitrilase
MMITKVEALISQCHSLDAQVAVFPDAFIGGYPKVAEFNIHADGRSPEGREEFAAYYRQSIVVPGPETLRLGDAARKANLFLTNGIIERESATLYFTVLFFGPNGTPLGKNRKLIQQASTISSVGIGDGSTLTVVDSRQNLSCRLLGNYMPLLRAAMHAQGIEIYCALLRMIETVGCPRCDTVPWRGDAACRQPVNIYDEKTFQVRCKINSQQATTTSSCGAEA